MKRIIFGEVLKKTEIFIGGVDGHTLIFSRKNGVINGTLISDGNQSYEWIHRIGSIQGAYGYFKTKEECIAKSQRHGYEFFIDQGGVHKKIILEERKDIIHFSKIKETDSIFAQRDGKLIGMVIREEQNKFFNGWIVRTGGQFGDYGHFSTLEDCIRVGKENYSMEFFIED